MAVSPARPLQPAPSLENRRRSERTPHTCRAWLASPTARGGDEAVEVSALNLSRHGVAFESTMAVPTEAYFVLKLDLGGQKSKSEVHVVSCRPAGPGRWAVGAEFC